MEYIGHSGIEVQDPTFAVRVKELSGVNVAPCYQCLTCTLGCPLSSEMDFHPHQIVRLVALGLKDTVLRSSSIWICASCESCVARCPNEIDIPHLIDTLHQIALREGIPAREPVVFNFHRIFLSSIKRLGRQYEILVAVLYMLKARRFSLKELISNAFLGLNLLKRGKLKLLPPLIKERGAIGEIFRKTEGRQR